MIIRRIRIFLFALLIGYLVYWFLSPRMFRFHHRQPPKHLHRIVVPQ
jgi:hypothetical protein